MFLADCIQSICIFRTDKNKKPGRINGLIFSYGKVHAILLGELFKITDTLFVDLNIRSTLILSQKLFHGLLSMNGRVSCLFHLHFFPVLQILADTANEDRKSTHLNSSHVSISYAGFCLK